MSKSWLAVKVALLLACLLVGLWSVQWFLVYSIQAGGLSGLSEYRDRYDIARTGQLLTLSEFLAAQVLGGTILRSMFRRGASSWLERLKSVFWFSAGFALLTGTIIAVIAAML